MTATTGNIGSAPAAPSMTRFYLSLDAVRNAGDKLLTGVHAVGSLPGGGAATTTLSVTVPSSMPIGSYHLLACADDQKHVAETSETNNCMPAPSTVNVSRADLVVQTTGVVGPTTVARGGVITASDNTRNQGLVTAGPSSTRYYLSLDAVKSSSDKPLTGSRAVAGLLTGAASQGSAQVTVPLDTTPGTYYLVACADASSAITELSETNNCTASASPAVTVTP